MSRSVGKRCVFSCSFGRCSRAARFQCGGWCVPSTLTNAHARGSGGCVHSRKGSTKCGGSTTRAQRAPCALLAVHKTLCFQLAGLIGMCVSSLRRDLPRPDALDLEDVDCRLSGSTTLIAEDESSSTAAASAHSLAPPAEPAPAEPASAEPAPAEPASAEPASVEPAPAEPASAEPAANASGATALAQPEESPH